MLRPPALLLVTLLSALPALGAVAGSPKPAPELPAPPADDHAADGLPPGLYAEFTVPPGTLIAELFAADAPLTVTNFAGLAEGRLGPKPGKPFYDGLTFHRVVPGFAVQGGDPLGNGTDGPGYFFPDEFAPGLRPDAAGILAMANGGPDTNGSQFIITLAPAEHLHYLHSVFGRVVRGLDLLPKLKEKDQMKVKILRLGPDAAAFADDPATFQRLAAAAKKFSGPTEPGPSGYCYDPAGLLPVNPPWAATLNIQLANFTRATGHRVYLHLLTRTPSEITGESPGAFAKMLAARLGLAPDAALLVYAADRHTWSLWLGDAPPPVPVETRLAEASKLTADTTQPAPLQLKLACDAALEAVFRALEPK